MRRLLPLLLLGGLAVGEQNLPEIARIEYVGVPTGVAAIAAGDGYLPAVQTFRSENRGHFRVPDLGLSTLYQTKLSGNPVGMTRHGGGVVIGTVSGTSLTLLEIRYEGSAERALKHGTIRLDDLQAPQVLRLGSSPSGPVAAVGHANGLLVASVRPRGRSHTELVARPGVRFIAASEPFHMDRDARLELAAVGEGGQLLQMQETEGRWSVVSESKLPIQDLAVRCVAGGDRRLWLGGARGGEAILALVAPGASRGPFNRRPGGGQGPGFEMFSFGRGSVDLIEVLGRDQLALGGVKDGRSWVAVLRLGRRPTIEYETGLTGTGVVTLGVNPARMGWSIAAGTRERSYHLLRIPGDRALPRDWTPWPEPAPEPPPGEQPAPPVEQPGEVEEESPFDEAWGPQDDEPRLAIFPRVSYEARERSDTEFVLVHIGAGVRRLRLSFVRDDGRVVQVTRLRLGSGQRTTVSLARELERLRLESFDGYVRIEGCPRHDLIVEGVIRSGQRQGPFQSSSQTQTLTAHWR